jgi:tRNA A37 methylthiotransferase MiaB
MKFKEYKGLDLAGIAADVLGEITEKVKNGAREIMLLGQTVNAYRDGDTTFPILLEKACA